MDKDVLRKIEVFCNSVIKTASYGTQKDWLEGRISIAEEVLKILHQKSR